MQHSAPARNWVGDNGKIIEPLFADYFLSLHPMRCFQGRLFTVDGMIEDEAPLKKEIYEQVRYYATTSVARRIEHIMQAIKLACASEPPEIQTDRIHVRNGTYFVDGHFTPEKEYCMNRLPISYVPEAPAPTRWLQFLNELLYEEDIPALQEYIGYCLLPVTKAQKMLLMVGKGGEGKSRIGLILRELFGSSMYTGSLQKVETNRFARADLEYKLLLVDDDMKTEALPQTNNIKTLVTLEDKIDIERKGQQSVQGTLYVRFACFGNGSLHALYDKSNGFYRRQLLLTTKEKPVGRVDDPFLIDKMRNEKEGILLWALEGLHRLIRNNYQFTISERTAANLKEAMEQGNNILGFLKSEGYFEIRQGAKCKSTDFYKVYERWCMDNLEKPLAACCPSACALPTICATAPPSSVFFGSAEASASRKTVSMRGSGQLEKGDNVWHILRNAAAPMVSAILTKTSRVKTATNGKVFPRKRRQRTERNRSSMNWRPEPF